MSIVRELTKQWNKAEWSYQLVLFWAKDKYVSSLFVGATNMTTVANVVAAMTTYPQKTPSKNFISIQTVFSALFDCFILLFVKELQQKKLSQAESIIVQLTEYFANQYLKELSTEEHILNQCQQVINAMEKLKLLRQQRRQTLRNMG